jgi:hypothetical protein
LGTAELRVMDMLIMMQNGARESKGDQPREMIANG